MLVMLAGGPMLQDPTFWVAVAFVGFIGLLVYYGVPGLVAKALDDRADQIRRDLDEARRLREDAQALLDEYQRKTRDADTEAKAIIDQARREAEALAGETRRNLTESLERRARLAEEKIARAEAQASSEVRAAAVDAAIAAAEKMIQARVTPEMAGRLADQGIRDLKGKLN